MNDPPPAGRLGGSPFPASKPALRPASVLQRLFVGVHVSSSCRRISAAAVTCVGRGLDARCDILAHLVEPGHPGILDLYQRVAAHKTSSPGAVATLASLLAEQQADLVRRLLAQAGNLIDRVVALGVYDPGLWDLTQSRRGYMSLCDAALVAELTGLSVVDAFPARDLAQGGQGGPLLAVPLAMLVRPAGKPRLLLDLGRTVRVTYIPAGERLVLPQLLSFDVGPGTGLLDRLAEQLTEGQHLFDHGGRLAVQGRQITQLVDHWLCDPYFHRPLPRWHPLGCRHEQELGQTVKMAIDAGWSVRDLLCTACHFVAETVARAVRELLPARPVVDTCILTGGGQQNGMLLRGIASRLPGMTFLRTADLNLDGDALDPAAAAVLAQCYVDQTPVNSPALTGVLTPRVAGRVTPGAPHHWLSLLRDMVDNRPALVPLRSAV